MVLERWKWNKSWSLVLPLFYSSTPTSNWPNGDHNKKRNSQIQKSQEIIHLFVVILKCFENFTAGCINANHSTKSSPILYLEPVDRCSSNGDLLKQIDKNGYCVSCCISRRAKKRNKWFSYSLLTLVKTIFL